MSGAESRQGDYTREFARALERKTGLPVVFRDERWTSREAERALRGSRVAPNERKPAIDRLSAVLLLQSYLDSAAVRLSKESAGPGARFDSDGNSSAAAARMEPAVRGISEESKI